LLFDLEFRPNVVAIQHVWVKAETVAGVVAYKQVNFDVRCGPNSNVVHLNEQNVYRVDVGKNQQG